ncbi:uncharacterized protein LOC119556924 [Drosophila subpulchrella]|uniref:uncharacterized protein LOC119556924 n=1 Tax=Drosophila subpulchrella TaxID=1486046 RepID=UPI0018A15F8F|nr:uncharacterized protein LOC119556924 [Drosophila subpulchrella]
MAASESIISAPPEDGAGNVILCVMCAKPFQRMLDCLAHELLDHDSLPQKKLRRRLYPSGRNQSQSERYELRKALYTSNHGAQLQAMLHFFAADLSKMEFCFDDVSTYIEKSMKGMVVVTFFGSLASDLAVRGSDIDMYIEPCGVQQPKKLLGQISRLLRRNKCFTDIVDIRRAVVPIIKCRHQPTGINIDINMSNPNGVHNSQFVRDFMSHDKRLRELTLFLKIWAKELKIIGQGCISSYCLVTLIIVSLQVLRLVPSIKKLQSLCPPVNVSGVNFAYSLNQMPTIPSQITTLELIKNFFDYYITVDFGKSVLCAFLGSCLDKDTSLGTPGGFPEYENQLRLIHGGGAEPPKGFPLERAMCVQDPFDLQRNVAGSMCPSKLHYFRQCLVLAAQGCSNREVISQPAKLYYYLLFGIADKLGSMGQVANNQKTEMAAPQKQLKVDVSGGSKETKLVYKAPTIGLSHLITPTRNEIKCLEEGVLTIYYYWLDCYVFAIRDVLTQLYALNIKLKESKPPHYFKWLISSPCDTWTGRSYQRGAGQSFFAHQLQQTIEFKKTRMENPQYAVNLRGYLSLLASEDYKELRMDVEPLPGDFLEPTLTKFFKIFKNMLNHYSFKEKTTTWKYRSESE